MPGESALHSSTINPIRLTSGELGTHLGNVGSRSMGIRNNGVASMLSFENIVDNDAVFRVEPRRFAGKVKISIPPIETRHRRPRFHSYVGDLASSDRQTDRRRADIARLPSATLRTLHPVLPRRAEPAPPSPIDASATERETPLADERPAGRIHQPRSRPTPMARRRNNHRRGRPCSHAVPGNRISRTDFPGSGFDRACSRASGRESHCSGHAP